MLVYCFFFFFYVVVMELIEEKHGGGDRDTIRCGANGDVSGYDTQVTW